jgi:hypothetical protein
MSQLMLHLSLFGGDSLSLSLSRPMLPPQHEGDWHRLSLHRLQLCCYTTNVVDWVVWRSNYHAVLSLATTGLDLLVPAPRHGSLPAVPRLVPSGTAPCMVPRPKGPVYRHRGCSSLMSWGMLQFNVMGDVPGCMGHVGPGCPCHCYSCFPCSQVT